MNKQEFYNSIVNALPITENKFNELWAEEEKLLVEKGFKDDDLQNAIIARLHAYFKRQLNPLSKAEKFSGFVIGITPFTDFGAKKLYDEAKAMHESNPDDAVLMGYVDKEGTPLYQKPEWKKGKKIDLLRDKSRTVYLLAAKDGDIGLKPANLQLNFDQAFEVTENGEYIEKDIPLFTPVIFKANVSKASKDDLYLLNSNSTTQFELDNANVDVKQSILKNYDIVPLAKLREWYYENQKNYSRMAVTMGNIMRLSITQGESMSNVIELDDSSLNMSEEESNTLTCWIPKSMKIDWVEGALNVLVIGKPSVNNEDKVSMQVYGVYVDEVWKNGLLQPPMPIKFVEGEG